MPTPPADDPRDRPGDPPGPAGAPGEPRPGGPPRGERAAVGAAFSRLQAAFHEEGIQYEAGDATAALGRTVLRFFEDTGRASALLGATVRGFVALPRYFGEVLTQMFGLGVGSLPLVAIVAAFTGAVTAV